jgi:hypothetical protein
VVATRQPPTQMSIAFLLGSQDKTKSIDLDGTRGYYESVSMPSQMLVAHLSPWMPTCDQTETDNTLFDTSSKQHDSPHRLCGHYSPQARSFERDIEISNPSNRHTSSSGTESFGYNPVGLSNDWSTSFH